MGDEGLFDISREFLKASQRGDLTSLKNLRLKYDVEDWTLYRHLVSGDTAIHLAAREGHYHVVSYLCEAWEKPSFKTEVANKDLKRPLHDAAQFASFKILQYLIEKGASIDPLKRADWTPLMLACAKPGEEATRCIYALLKEGAASNLKNKDGWTPLLLACRTGNLEAVEMLLKQSRDNIQARSKNGRNALHVAAFHGHVEVIDFLLSQDEENRLINSRDSSGSTPLLELVKSGNLRTFEYLLRRGADVGAVDNVGQNVLHFAAQAGNIEIMKFIIDHRLVDIDSEASLEITPLMLAEKNKQSEAVRLLSSANRAH